MRYDVRGVGTAIATAAANEAHAALWNPASNRRIKVVEIGYHLNDFTTIASSLYIARISARGTAGATVTPDADNSEAGDAAPPSGALLDLAEYSVQPTIASPELYGLATLPVYSGATAGGSGFHTPFPRGIWLPPGSGLGIFDRGGDTFGNAFAVEASFAFED